MGKLFDISRALAVAIRDNTGITTKLRPSAKAINTGELPVVPCIVLQGPTVDPRAMNFRREYEEAGTNEHGTKIRDVRKWRVETELTFRLLVGQCVVLLVPDDGGASNDAYYIETFRSLGVPYVIDESQGSAKIRSNRLCDYSEVIWFTGSEESNTLTQEEQSDLQAFLDGGGKLLMSGNMIGYDIGDSPFYRNYLHGDYVSFMTMLHHLDGVPSNPVVGGREITLASVGRNAQGFAAETDPISPAVSIFDYARDTEEGPGIIRSSGSGALAVETSIYKLVYLSFGMEGIEPLEERIQVLLDVLSWFKEPGVGKGDVDGNGTTDVIDAVVAVNIVLGVHQADERELARADMNYDGTIDIIDIVKVVNAVLGASGKGAIGDSMGM